MNEFGAVVSLFSQYHPEKMTSLIQIYDFNFNIRQRKTLTGFNTVCLIDKQDVLVLSNNQTYLRMDKQGAIESFLDKYDQNDPQNYFGKGMVFKCFSLESNRAILYDSGDLYIISIATGHLVSTIALNTFTTWDVKINGDFIYLLRLAEFAVYDLDGNLLCKKCIPDLAYMNTFEIVDGNNVYFRFNYSNKFLVI